MKKLHLILVMLMALIEEPRLQAQCHHFTQEHVDLLSIQWNAASNTLSLMASDDDHGGTLYASNECVVVCPEIMKFSLPGGTPLGNEGEPLWILPQNPYTGVPYVGVSSEAIPPGAFIDPMTLQLTRIEGPGHFIAWQAVGFGAIDIKMDTRDGINASDKFTPFVGGHEHHNLGFTTSGVYRVHFQVSGRRPGESTNIFSAETPFTFHILPLKPFENWVATNWPCESDPVIASAGADPDQDRASNLLEYALGTDPKEPSAGGQLTTRLVTIGDQMFVELSFTRAKTATDCSCEVVAAHALTEIQWQSLTGIHSIADHGTTERITLRDPIPVGASKQRFYQLRAQLHAP